MSWNVVQYPYTREINLANLQQTFKKFSENEKIQRNQAEKILDQLFFALQFERKITLYHGNNKTYSLEKMIIEDVMKEEKQLDFNGFKRLLFTAFSVERNQYSNRLKFAKEVEVNKKQKSNKNFVFLTNYGD